LQGPQEDVPFCGIFFPVSERSAGECPMLRVEERRSA